MTISRRDVLLQGSVIGAGIIAANVPGMVALAQAQAVPQRRSLQGLAWDDPIVATYRDAVGLMKNMPASEQFSWVNLANIHGPTQFSYKFCPHGNWYFLPWHRAYTLMYERIVRYLTKNDDFAMPYWDWTANPTMPEVFLEPNTPDGNTNWLFVSDPGFMRTWPPSEPMPPDVVGPSVLQEILAATTFEEFGTSRPAGQDSLDQSWIVCQNCGIQGVLEGNPHNNVHNNIGGLMPWAFSPRDPIFFMHHANIDRIWAVWNGLGGPNSPDPLWKDMTIENNFYNVDGSFYSPKVSDLFVPETLGYTYGLPGPMASAAPTLMAAQEKFTSIYAGAAAATAVGIKTYAAQSPEGAVATPNRYLEIPVAIEPGLVESVARSGMLSSGVELLDFNAAREQAVSGTRALAFIREVAVSDSQNTMYRVFIEHPDLKPDTPVTDPHYVGTFGVFVHGEGANHDEPSFAVDLSPAIRRVYGSAPAPTNIRVQILPVPNKPDEGEAGTATVRAVEVAFVSA